MIRGTRFRFLGVLRMFGSTGLFRRQSLTVSALTVACVALFLAPVAQGATYVVAIGNNQGRTDEPQLRYAERDARRLIDVLHQLGRVPAENGVLIRASSAADVTATLLRLNARIRRAEQRGAEPSALLVYYSGHADARGLHLGQSTLRFEQLKTIVESSPAKVRVLVVDSCRSGGLTQVKGARPAKSFEIQLQDRLKIEGMAIITSSASSEDSQESLRLGGSFFTHHLVAALRGAADRNRDGLVTLNEAYSYAYQETLRSSGKTLQLQHPTYAYDIKGKGVFVLAYLQDQKRRFGRLKLDKPGAYLVYAGSANGQLAAEVQVQPRGSVLVLQPDRYFVQRRASRSYREYQVELSAGQTVGLSGQPYREYTYARLLRKGGGQARVVQALSIASALRGPLVSGQSILPQALIGYGLDFPWFSSTLQLRFGHGPIDAPDSAIGIRQTEAGLRLRVERYIDFDRFSVSLGVFVEGALMLQTFDSAGDAPSRSSWSFAFGGLAATEYQLSRSWALRAEVGPISTLLRKATVRSGAISGRDLASPLTWWFSLGAARRF